MPKAAPTEVIVHRIEFQESERKLLESYLLAYSAGKVGELGQGLGIPEIAKMLDDPLKIVQVAYSLATIIEFFGIETGWPTAADAGGWYEERQSKLARMKAEREEAGGSTGVAGQILDTLRVLFGIDPSPRWGEDGQWHYSTE